MFMHGRRPVANARRLVGDLPMRYWLVDIGGGTVNSGDGKYIGLEYIRSNAMKALWKGMTAIPWEGPPPVNAGGLASIISQAASIPLWFPAWRMTWGSAAISSWERIIAISSHVSDFILHG